MTGTWTEEQQVLKHAQVQSEADGYKTFHTGLLLGAVKTLVGQQPPTM